jgi:uncharacterized protein (TIGR03435 family)
MFVTTTNASRFPEEGWEEKRNLRQSLADLTGLSFVQLPMVRMNRTLIAPLLVTATLHAQTFDAASIKRSASGNPGGTTFELLAGGTLRVRNSTLRGVIETAYDVRDFQIIGGPPWLDADRYDLLARSQPGDRAASRAEDMRATRLKLQALLADRFHLVVHREAREMQEYALVVAKSESRLVAVPAGTPPAAHAGVLSTCGRMTGTQAPISGLALYISRELKRPVLDRTGLAGRYNFELSWTPELAPCAEAADNAPSIFTALLEQLGLRLDSIKGPVDTVVVDRVEKPSED